MSYSSSQLVIVMESVVTDSAVARRMVLNVGLYQHAEIVKAIHARIVSRRV